MLPALRFAFTVILLGAGFPPLFAATSTAPAPDTIVARIDGEPVLADEYRFYAARARGRVITHALDAGLDQTRTDFWQTPLDDQTPATLLRETALREVARSRTLQHLALTEGLLDAPVGFRALLALRARENARRAELLRAGAVFYGPTRLSVPVFIDRWHAGLLDRLVLAEVRRGQPTASAARRDRIRRAMTERINTAASAATITPVSAAPAPLPAP